MTRELYLNNSGHRWISVHNGKRYMPFVLVLPDGTRKERQADFYEAFGNFYVIHYRYKGRRFQGLPKCSDGFETRGPEDDGRTYVFHKEKE